MNNTSIAIKSIANMDDNVYERQMRLWDQRKILSSTAVVVGAGAIGNELVKNLALMGVGRIYVIDYDEVVMSNLNRCVFFRRDDAKNGYKKAELVAKRAMELNPDIEAIPIIDDVQNVSDEIFKQATCVLMGLDNLAARLAVNLRCCMLEKPLIDGAIEGFHVYVQTVIPPSSPCIECGVTDEDFNRIWEKLSCTGDVPYSEDPKLPYVPMAASVVAGIQTTEFAKIAVGYGQFKENKTWDKNLGEPLVGKALYIDLRTNLYYIYDIPKRADCNACSL